MAVTGYLRGHPVDYVDGEWLYEDGTIADPDAPCARCHEPPTPEGYDPCIGHVPGAVAVCCGHGIPGEAYFRD